jgi:hypothetical protein
MPCGRGRSGPGHLALRSTRRIAIRPSRRVWLGIDRAVCSSRGLLCIGHANPGRGSVTSRRPTRVLPGLSFG